MPNDFARELFKITHVGGTVIVSNSCKLPSMTLTGSPSGSGPSGGKWTGISKSAATSVVVSTSQRWAAVYQNGKRVGSSPVSFRGSQGRSRNGKL